MDYSRSTVLIWGGAGFIGSHLCEALLRLGARIICADNLSTGSEDNIRHLQSDARFRFIRSDICDELSFPERIDVAFNLASPASMSAIRQDPLACIAGNVLGTMKFLHMVERHGARAVLASTSEVYGDPEVTPQPETYRGCVNTIGPRSCYDESKRLLETVSYEFHRRGVDVRLARIFNTYGPRLPKNDARVVPRFLRNAFANRPLRIYGDGSVTRSFCYVDDQVDGLIALSRAETNELLVCNIGTDEEVTMLDLAKRIRLITGTDSEIIFDKAREDDPTHRKPNLTFTLSQLDWRPRITLDEGLAKAAEYYKSFRDIEI